MARRAIEIGKFKRPQDRPRPLSRYERDFVDLLKVIIKDYKGDTDAFFAKNRRKLAKTKIQAEKPSKGTNPFKGIL